VTETLKIENLFSIDGKTALVTGGSRGIGEMIAAGFLANGATVYISSRKADVCDATAERLASTYGGTCVSLPADLSNLEGIDALTAALSEHTDNLDILVNNAGASWGARSRSSPRTAGTR
jgi:NAD(P)-dependent dehydrogenase (short-subunit alcohol dehydrogenase family)